LCYHLAFLVSEVGIVTRGFFPSKGSLLLEPLLRLAFHNFSNTLVNFVTAVFLEVTPNIAEQRDVTDRCCDQKQQGAGKDYDGERNRDQEGGCDKASIGEPREIPKAAWSIFLREIDGV